MISVAGLARLERTRAKAAKAREEEANKNAPDQRQETLRRILAMCSAVPVGSDLRAGVLQMHNLVFKGLSKVSRRIPVAEVGTVGSAVVVRWRRDEKNLLGLVLAEGDKWPTMVFDTNGGRATHPMTISAFVDDMHLLFPEHFGKGKGRRPPLKWEASETEVGNV